MLFIYRVCAYLFVVRDLWLIADVPQVARACFVVKSGNVSHPGAVNVQSTNTLASFAEHKKCGALSVYK